MAYSNWGLIHKAYTKLDWGEIERIYESAKDCPHTLSAYKHAMAIYPFPRCLLNTKQTVTSEPKAIDYDNKRLIQLISSLLGVKIPDKRAINTIDKIQLLGHIWWHYQNKANKISHKQLAEIADTISYISKLNQLSEFFNDELINYFTVYCP